MSERYIDAKEVAQRMLLLRLRLDPDVEVDALAVDHNFSLADLGFQDDPVIEYQVPRVRNLERELNSHGSMWEVETGVVSGRHHENPLGEVRQA